MAELPPTSLQAFGEIELAVAVRVPVGDLADLRKAVSKEKVRCLILHRVHVDILAASGDGLALRLRKQRRTDALRASLRVNGH